MKKKLTKNRRHSERLSISQSKKFRANYKIKAKWKKLAVARMMMIKFTKTKKSPMYKYLRRKNVVAAAKIRSRDKALCASEVASLSTYLTSRRLILLRNQNQMTCGSSLSYKETWIMKIQSFKRPRISSKSLLLKR